MRHRYLTSTALTCLVLLPLAAEAQPKFEIGFGPQYGVQDPERPTKPGWIVSSGFDLGTHTFVVEGSWHLDTHVREASVGL